MLLPPFNYKNTYRAYLINFNNMNKLFLEDLNERHQRKEKQGKVL